MILLFIKIYLLTVFSNLLIMVFFLNSKSFIDAYNSFDYNKKLRKYIPITLVFSAFFPLVNIIYTYYYIQSVIKYNTFFSEILIYTIKENIKEDSK